MMPKARPRRRSGWLFGSRGNRRVRPPSGQVPVRASRGPGLKRIALMILVAGALGGAGYGAFRFVTTSKHFSVKQLRFSATRHVQSASLEARAGVALGTNLFALDLSEIAREVMAEPWVARAHARRELPNTVVVDVVEREAACVVSLGTLYLADAGGQVFKRATPEEAASLPVVTGLERDLYLGEPERTRARIREGLSLVEAWNRRAGRPQLGEIHLDAKRGVTLYTALGVGIRIGHVDPSLAERLARFDAVWAALETSGEHARLIYLDNRARPDRVTVKLQQTKKSET
jgi:cell division protein FtsQ